MTKISAPKTSAKTSLLKKVWNWVTGNNSEEREAEQRKAGRLNAKFLKEKKRKAERRKAERIEAERIEAERRKAQRLEAERHDAERLKDTTQFFKIISVDTDGIPDYKIVFYKMNYRREDVFFTFGDYSSGKKIDFLAFDGELPNINFFNMGQAGRFKFAEDESFTIIDESHFFDINAGNDQHDSNRSHNLSREVRGP